jgi:hypothetical protein
MNTCYFDPQLDDDARRERLYDGQLVVLSPRTATVALVQHARLMIEEAFGATDPLTAQYDMPVERYVEICAPLKPAFIHNDRTKELLRGVVDAFGCDLDDTYVDVPRLRMVTSDGYLTSGVGYAHHPHRDVWYSAPFQQLNWWLPIYEIESDSSMAFHPRYWSEPVRNGSADFNYYEWNSGGRKDAAKQIGKDTRKQPKPEEPMELQPEIRLVTQPGGIVVFSAAHMHSTVPNTTGRARYSIDFRTVSRSDLEAGRGAPNLDTACTGTSLRDFARGSDGERLPEDVVALYDSGDRAGELVFQATS